MAVLASAAPSPSSSLSWAAGWPSWVATSRPWPRPRHGRAAGRVSPYAVDVREPELVEAALDRVGSELGAVDTLVNNAGGQFVSPAESISLKASGP